MESKKACSSINFFLNHKDYIKINFLKLYISIFNGIIYFYYFFYKRFI